MRNALRLQVSLQAIDKVTAPLKKILGGSNAAASALRGARDRLRELGRVQKDVGAFRELRQGTAQTARQLATAREMVAQLAAKMAAADAPSKRLAATFGKAKREAAALTSQHREQMAQLQGLRGRLAAAGVSTSSLGQHERRLRSEIRATTTEMQRQEARLKSLSTAQRRWQQAQSASLQAGAYGYGAMYAGRRGLQTAGVGLAPGLGFEQAMSSVQGLARLSKEDPRMRMLEEEARRLGASTLYTGTEAGQGMSFLAMAGFTPDAIKASMQSMLNVALAGDMELPRTADIVSNISSAYGIDSSNSAAMQHLADTLVMGFTTSNTDLEMLGETMKYFAPIAKAGGIDLGTSVAMAGMLGNVGIQGSMAGTTLREMTSRMAALPAPARKALKSLGVSTLEDNGDLRNIVEVIADIDRAMTEQGLGSGERLAALNDIFGKRAMTGMADLAEKMGQGEFQRYLEVLRDVDGASQNLADVRADNLVGDLNALKSTAQDVGIEIYSQLLPTLRSLAAGATIALRSFGLWARENPTLTRALALLALTVSTLMTVLGGLTVAAAATLLPFAGLRWAMAMLGVQGGTLLGMLKGVTSRALPSLGAAAKAVLPALAGVSWPLVALGAAVAGVALLIWKYWGPIKAFLGGFFEGFIDGIRPVLDALAPAFAWLGGGLAKLGQGLAWLVAPADASAEALGTAANIGRAIGFAVGTVLRPIQWLGELLGWLAFQVVDKLGRGWEIARGQLASVVQYFRGAWDVIAGIFTGNWARVRQGVTTQLAAISGIFGGLPERMAQIGADIIAGLAQGIRNAGGAVRDAVVGAAGNVRDWFAERLKIRSPSRVFAELGMHTMDGLAVGLERGEDGPLERVSSLARRLASGAIVAGAAMPALAIDSRPPVAPAAMAAPAGGNTYQVHIHAAPGMDPQAIARAVTAELDRRDRAAAARRRSALTDLD